MDSSVTVKRVSCSKNATTSSLSQ